MNYLIFFTILLGVIMVAQLIRVYELSNELRGATEEKINPSDNRMNAALLMLFGIAFFAFFIWQCYKWMPLALPVSASAHGVEIDWLLNFNFVIIIAIFFITNAFLFYFASKYYFKKDNKEVAFFTHSSKLELVWTVVPAIVLTVIIIYGLRTWNNIMGDAPADAMRIELYAKQFSWTARYTGADEQLGRYHYRLISGENALGLDSIDSHTWDDIIVRNEFHIPVNKSVHFVYRSQDVIHSAYMPHFRAQMNCVPGMTTQFHFVPTITSKEMKEITKNKDFEYVLLCNKICGAAHSNMQMNIIVDTQEDYDKWLKEVAGKHSYMKVKAATASVSEVGDKEIGK